MIGVLFIGSCDACDACTGCLLTIEVELHEEHIWEMEPLAYVLEGKCTKGPLYLWIITLHIHACV